MVIINKGTVFNTDAKAIVNTVNCKGVMGAGIALEFQLRYPAMNEEYIRKCEDGSIRVGKVDYYDGDPIIINFPTKYDFKFPSKIEWVEAGLQDFISTYSNHNIDTVAFPKLGAGRGGLDWQQVKALMIRYLDPLDIKVYICEDTLPYAEGIEKEMVDRLNKTSASMLASKIRLNDKQRVAIDSGKPYIRFWHLGRIDSIGAKTYENVFKYFYNKCINMSGEQINMLDEGLLSMD